jgi:hypothetical protein
MIAVQNDFKTRAEEVTRYFQFLREFDERRVVFQDAPRAKPVMPPVEQTALFKTLKANGFMLLYNLVESTLKNAIEAIYDEFKSRAVSFDSCLEKVRNIVLTNVKRRSVDDMLPNLSSISVDIVVATFRKDELFSGNVDGRRVREVADSYGFRRPAKRSDKLLTVKAIRNDLAHGNKSFAEVGRNYDIEELEEIQTEIITFLEELLANVADYITTRAYLSSPPPAPAVAGSS